MIQCRCGSVICRKHCFQSSDGWKLSIGEVFCWEMLIPWIQNLLCRSITVAGVSWQIKTVGAICSRSWQGRPLFRDSVLLRTQFEREGFSLDWNCSIPAPPGPKYPTLSAQRTPGTSTPELLIKQTLWSRNPCPPISLKPSAKGWGVKWGHSDQEGLKLSYLIPVDLEQRCRGKGALKIGGISAKQQKCQGVIAFTDSYSEAW